MLKHTFIHIPNIGRRIERRLWREGVTDWGRVEGAALSLSFKERLLEEVSISSERLLRGDSGYFYERLPSEEQWRLFGEFRGSCAYIDIETGLDAGRDIITTASLWDGKEIMWYVNGDNLREFPERLLEYKLAVTYNGKCFDMPFIARFFGVEVNIPHIDLRYPLKAVGLCGGVKKVEKRLGISRGELDGVDGYMAVLLWGEYKSRGNLRALETLIAYNIEDVVNLEKIMYFVYNKKLEETPFGREKLEFEEREIPVGFKADRGLVERLWERRMY
ncbi:MAG: ribonuclease H-like domain-containing protein [Myxococcota bacterium]